MPLLLALDKLMRPERHALAQARDQKCISHGQQCEILAERDFLCVQENDGLVCQSRKCRVDASDCVRNPASKFVRLGRLQRDLEQDDL
jgi:hypothetical protein